MAKERNLALIPDIKAVGSNEGWKVNELWKKILNFGVSYWIVECSQLSYL